MPALRARQQRNFLATLFLSQGVPMLLGGDEIGRTQRGNNNAYCQDNEISWFDWENVDEALLEFTRQADRAAPRTIRCSAGAGGFSGRSARTGSATSAGSRPDGEEMDDAGLAGAASRKSLGVFLNGEAIPTPDQRGEPGRATTASTCCSTPTTRRSPSGCRSGRSGGRAGSGCSIRRRRFSRKGRRSPPARKCGSRRGRWCC